MKLKAIKESVSDNYSRKTDKFNQPITNYFDKFFN